MMNKKKLNQYIILGLICLNIGVLACFLLIKPNNRPIQASITNMQSEAITILHLNMQQAANFRVLADAHRQKMKEFDELQEKLLPVYFESLVISSDSAQRDSLLNQFEFLDKKKVEATYQHFSDVKALLTEEQLPYFKTFIHRITDRLLARKKKKSFPPKDME